MSLNVTRLFLKYPYWVFLSLFFVIYLLKLSGLFWVEGVSDHLSNFALTGVGSLLFISPTVFGRKRALWWVGTVIGFFIIANCIVEGMALGTLHGFNVVDSLDALYGVAAAVIVLVIHLYIRRKGRREE